MKILFIVLVLSISLTNCNSNKKRKSDSLLAVNQPDIKKSINRGKLIYQDFCMSCHMADGKGAGRAFPPLANSDYLRDKQTESIKAVKNGLSGRIEVNGTVYNSVMSPLGLTNEEVADVMNYINNSWGNEIDNYVTKEKVSKL